jgi:hypothetical protein
MQSRRKLRFRLIVSFALFGFGLSALFAVAALNIRAKVESQLVTASLQQDVDQAVEKVHKDPTKPAGSDLIEAWMRSDRTLYNMPLSWQALDSGVHDIYETGADGTRHHYKLAVRKKYGLIGFIRYDVTRDELGKQQLLFSVIGAVFLFGLL